MTTVESLKKTSSHLKAKHDVKEEKFHFWKDKVEVFSSCPTIKYNQQPWTTCIKQTRKDSERERSQTDQGQRDLRNDIAVSSLGFLLGSCIPGLKLKKSAIQKCQEV